MSGRTSILPMLAAALLLGGCDDGGITDPGLATDPQLLAETTTGASAETMVPIKWTYSMTAAGGDLTCANSDGSPPFLSITANWTATGVMSHLGRIDPQSSSAQFSSCLVNVVDGYPVSAEGGAAVQLVGANGDAVYLEGVLSVSFADFSATGDWTITGGTGRFAGASGWIETLEMASETGDGSEGEGSGMITPPGTLGH